MYAENSFFKEGVIFKKKHSFCISSKQEAEERVKDSLVFKKEFNLTWMKTDTGSHSSNQ